MAPHLTLHLLTKMLGMLLVLLAMGLVQGEVQVGEVQVEEMQGEVQVEEVQVGEVQMGEVEEVQGEGAATTWDPWAPCTTDADCPEGLLCNVHQGRCTECMDDTDCPDCGQVN